MRTTSAVLLAAALVLSPGFAARSAETFPTKPVTIVVPFAAGGSTDLSARALGEAASKQLGQPFVIENKPGGSGAVAIAAMLRAPADGHTLLIMGSTQVANQYMNDVPYDVERDIVPIAHVTSYNAGLVVRSDAPWKTFKDFVEHVKANPGAISYGSSAAGTPQHLIMEKLAAAQGLKMKFVPFGGGVQTITAVLGGHIQAASQVTEWKPHVESGDLRLLVTYGAQRMPQFPNVPTLTELGYGTSYLGFNSVVARKGTPPAAIKALGDAFKVTLDDPQSEFNKLMTRYDLVTDYKGPEEYQAFLTKFMQDTKAMLELSQLTKK